MTVLTIPQACKLLSEGEVITVPTESVYGFSVDPRIETAVQALMLLKGRPQEKGFIVVASMVEQLEPWIAPLSSSLQAQVRATWPGPHTWILPARNDVPAYLLGSRTTLAVRVSAHPVVQALCDAYGSALISTSANPSGKPAVKTVAELELFFGADLPPILEGSLGGDENPTKIWDGETGKRLR